VNVCNTHRNIPRAANQVQIPLYRLPGDVRDKLVTSPLAQIPLRRLTRNFPARGSFGEGGVMEFGLKRAAVHSVRAPLTKIYFLR